MTTKKLYVAMVGLPARGKSTIASKLKENLSRDAVKARIFNNGDLRRKLVTQDTSSPEFYDPANTDGVAIREKIAFTNIGRAKAFLSKGGHVAIVDATNVSRKRRKIISQMLDDHPLLFLECINDDDDILEASIQRKISLREFDHLEKGQAIQSFKRRIDFYTSIYEPLTEERNQVKLNSLYNRILHEKIMDEIPFYDRIRDFLVTDIVNSLFLIRHGETHFNLENRIGGDSPLTENGLAQAGALASYFQSKEIPVIFTSRKKRTIQTAKPIRDAQKESMIIALEEFNEIDSGVCECMSYEEIRDRMPEVYASRQDDKYHYIYPRGEGYETMKARIDRGIKKALYISARSPNIMVIGHRAVNRMILSHFLYRREEDVPYIYIPQDKFYHIIATQNKKLFELKKYQA